MRSERKTEIQNIVQTFSRKLYDTNFAIIKTQRSMESLQYLCSITRSVQKGVADKQRHVEEPQNGIKASDDY